MKLLRGLGMALWGLGATGCGVGRLAQTTATPPRVDKKVAAGGTRPMLVDWGPNDRTLLNTSRAMGPLVVRFSEGTLEPLFGCRAKGAYVYSPEKSMQVQDDIIENGDELRAKLPAFGARFETELTRAGKLHVRMKVIGLYTADQPYFRHADLAGDCPGATHVASHVTVGAFRLFALSRAALKGDVALGGAEVGGASSAAEEALNEAGDEAACAQAAGTDRQPPDGCSTSLQFVLAPLDGGADAPVRAERGGGQRVAAYVTGGVGVASLLTAGGLMLAAKSKYGAADSHCQGSVCDATGKQLTDDARGLGDVATVASVIGGLALAGGAALWFAAPRANPRAPSTAFVVSPHGVFAQGAF